MKRNRQASLGVGAVIARLFWLAVVCGAGWCIREGWSRGEWPWSLWQQGSSLRGVTVLSRADWGAAKPQGELQAMRPPTRITLHHSGGKNAVDGDREAAARIVRAIQTEHLRTRGWSDIGYHFAVDRAGRIWEGRPVTQQGAHAGSSAANDRNVGIVCLGNFDQQSPSPAQLESLGRLVGALRARYGIKRAQVLSHNEVRGDCGLGPTSCPGKGLGAWLTAYRSGRGSGSTRAVGAVEGDAESPSGGAGAALVRS